MGNLGDMLVAAKKITSIQLDEALKCQVIFGGRIGTNLIELGYLSEEDLCRFLSIQQQVPMADRDKLMTVPPNLLEVIPREIVIKFRVIPCQLEKKRLGLAMVDPLNLAAIDEISFRTGFIVVPMVAPELWIAHALEKYYEVKRERRYINVSSEIARGPASAPLASGVGSPVPVRTSTSDELQEIEVAEEFEGFHTLANELEEMGSYSTQKMSPTVPLATAVSAPAPAGEMASGPASPPQAAPNVHTSSLGKGDAPYLLEDLSADLAGAVDREGIADALLKYLGQNYNRAALFIVKGNSAVGWRAVVRKRAIEEFDSLQISFDEPSVLKLVAEGKSFYLGPIPETVQNRLMLAAMGSGTLPNALLIPLVMMGRVVSILYVDSDQSTLSGNLPVLQKIVAKASFAFEILILRAKILVQ